MDTVLHGYMKTQHAIYIHTIQCILKQTRRHIDTVLQKTQQAIYKIYTEYPKTDPLINGHRIVHTKDTAGYIQSILTQTLSIWYLVKVLQNDSKYPETDSAAHG